ncbi:MAG: GrpB family protein [Saprospiraceae bacterium]|nr:GrpB family protein [Saprospiraceae bacterium]
MLIQKYQEHWENDFDKIKEVLSEHIFQNGIQIEHIGSTSIKNLSAKPIIDIDIAYNNPGLFEEIKTGLEKLGYYHNGNQGIEGREVFKREKKKDIHLVLDSISHHLYVCHITCEELHRHLNFRNYLRNHEKARKEYEKLKYEIAEKANQDKKEYAKLKEIMAKDFVASILNKSKEKNKPNAVSG